MKRPPGQLRIIGGRWRSRLIQVVDVSGLRPTPNRVRQTVFDWLSPRIEGAAALDLFAGTGAMGLEALSRGASQVTFVDRDSALVQALATAIGRFGAQAEAQVHRHDALAWLSMQPAGALYDLVFVDPPFGSELIEPALQRLAPLLKPQNRVYLEWLAHAEPALPAGYAWQKKARAGQVSYGLAAFEGKACP